MSIQCGQCRKFNAVAVWRWNMSAAFSAMARLNPNGKICTMALCDDCRESVWNRWGPVIQDTWRSRDIVDGEDDPRLSLW